MEPSHSLLVSVLFWMESNLSAPVKTLFSYINFKGDGCIIISSASLEMCLSLRTLQDTQMPVQQGWASVSGWVGNVSTLLYLGMRWETAAWLHRAQNLVLDWCPEGSAVAWKLMGGMLPLERMGESCAAVWIVRCVFWGHSLQTPYCGSLGQDYKKITSHCAAPSSTLQPCEYLVWSCAQMGEITRAVGVGTRW